MSNTWKKLDLFFPCPVGDCIGWRRSFAINSDREKLVAEEESTVELMT